LARCTRKLKERSVTSRPRPSETWDRGGDKWAAYKRSQSYENGLGVEKNRAIANFWYTLASSPVAMCG
jgi:hypothetical protein